MMQKPSLKMSTPQLNREIIRCHVASVLAYIVTPWKTKEISQELLKGKNMWCCHILYTFFLYVIMCMWVKHQTKLFIQLVSGDMQRKAVQHNLWVRVCNSNAVLFMLFIVFFLFVINLILGKAGLPSTGQRMVSINMQGQPNNQNRNTEHE